MKDHWGRVKADLMGSKKHRPASHHNRSFVRAAITVITKSLDPEQFVEAQLKNTKRPDQAQPSLLSGPGALDRYHEYLESGTDEGVAFYKAKFLYAHSLMQAGKKPLDIAAGAYDIPPLLMWILMVSFSEDPSPYENAARHEYRRHPEAKLVFGDIVDRLGVGHGIN